MIPFLTVSFLAILIQTVFLPLNLAVLFLVSGLGYFPAEVWPMVAGLLGLFYDLSSGGTLGKTSLVFLLLGLVIWFYSRKWKVGHPLALFVFTVVGDLISRIIWGLPLSWGQTLVIGLLAALWGWWLRRMGGTEKIRLAI